MNHDTLSAAESYRTGVMSLQEGAIAARVSIHEMMECIQQKRIRPPVQSKEEIEMDITDASVIFKKVMIKNELRN